jgi:drug/metabolite transporter (DMT)-like permease
VWFEVQAVSMVLCWPLFIASYGIDDCLIFMKHTLTFERYMVLVAVMLTASIGDTLLSHGMSQVGAVSLSHLGMLFTAMKNPWVIGGILCLLGFFASYLTALSWADLTFVLPSTAFGYIVVALLAHFWQHEHISLSRWVGILLIVGGVGFVANGPSLTPQPESASVAE